MDEQTLLTWLEWLFSFGGSWAVYAGVLGILLASGLGLPLPEDIPLLVGGVLCHMGHAELWIMIPSCTIAVFAADVMLYVLGRRYGHHVNRLPLLSAYLTEPRLAAAEIAFHRHGGKTLFVGRFLPGVRTAVFFTAGVFKIPFWKMLVVDGLASLVSVPALILAGYYGAKKLQQVHDWLGIANVAILVTAALSVIGYVVWRRVRRRRQAQQEAQQAAASVAIVPVIAPAPVPTPAINGNPVAAPSSAPPANVGDSVAATAAKLASKTGPLAS
jgi:membrane protein DedA with SNARE-associated domain